jgi:hypothetical protein
MLELSPMFWERTRARLDPRKLATELGPIDVPATLFDTTASAEQNL